MPKPDCTEYHEFENHTRLVSLRDTFALLLKLGGTSTEDIQRLNTLLECAYVTGKVTGISHIADEIGTPAA